MWELVRSSAAVVLQATEFAASHGFRFAPYVEYEGPFFQRGSPGRRRQLLLRALKAEGRADADQGDAAVRVFELSQALDERWLRADTATPARASGRCTVIGLVPVNASAQKRDRDSDHFLKSISTSLVSPAVISISRRVDLLPRTASLKNEPIR